MFSPCPLHLYSSKYYYSCAKVPRVWNVIQRVLTVLGRYATDLCECVHNTQKQKSSWLRKKLKNKNKIENKTKKRKKTPLGASNTCRPAHITAAGS